MQSPVDPTPKPSPMEEYDISLETGFVPVTTPMHLPPAFDSWERALHTASEIFGATNDALSSTNSDAKDLWKHRVSELPVIETSILNDNLGSLQRAHLVLSFLVQYFVHGGSAQMADIDNRITVPKALAIPLVAVSKQLGIAPVLTYADVVLWNVAPVNPHLPYQNGNIRCTHTFSGTKDEFEFYLTCAQVEFRGVELLQIIQDQQNMTFQDEPKYILKLTKHLERVVKIIEDLADITQSVRARCDPHAFYNHIRPWWKGSDANGPGSPGWIYDGVDENSKLDLSGPSAGQTSVMHALDIWLGVDHKLLEKRLPEPSELNKRADKGFMERMRRYMPGPHRRYLQDLENTPGKLRDIVQDIPALHKPYDEAVLALKRFRDGHIKIAVLYTISASKGVRSSNGPVRGTGGTDLTTLLKAGRDASARTMLQSGNLNSALVPTVQ